MGTLSFDFLLDYINEMIGSNVVPLYILPLVILVGAFFLIFGSRIFKVVIIILMFIGGGILAYLVSEHNWPITIAAAIGAGLIAYPLHYLFGILLTGVALGGVLSQVMYYLTNFQMSVLGFAVGMLLGIALGVIFFRPGMIFATSVISSAAITLSILILVAENFHFKETVAVDKISLDLIEVSILGGAIFACGVCVQSIMEVMRRKAKKKKSKQEE